MAPLSTAYSGSKSMRAGIIWLVFTGFPDPGAVMDRVLFDRVGVDRLTAGRLKAAGSISGIVEDGGGLWRLDHDQRLTVACGEMATRSAIKRS